MCQSESVTSPLLLSHPSVSPGAPPPTSPPTSPPATSVRTALSSSLFQLLSTYWVLMVVAAFLLVALTGSPNIFTAIYLVCFFLFLCTYQVGSETCL